MPHEVEHWPSHLDALTPLSKVTGNWRHGDQVYEETDWSINREISTDLPDQVRGSQGISVATAQLRLPPLEHVSGRLLASVRSVSNASDDFAAGVGGALTVNLPAGTQDGDMLILFHSFTDDDGLNIGPDDASAPTGDWELFATTPLGDTVAEAYWRIADGEPASWDINYFHSTEPLFAEITVVAIRDADVSRAPFAASHERQVIPSGENFAWTPVVPTGADRVLDLRYVSAFIGDTVTSDMWLDDPEFTKLAETAAGPSGDDTAYVTAATYTRDLEDQERAAPHKFFADRLLFGKVNGLTVTVPSLPITDRAALIPAVTPGHWSPWRSTHLSRIDRPIQIEAGYGLRTDEFQTIPRHRSTSTATSAGGTPFTINAPTGVADRDLLIAFIMAGGTSIHSDDMIISGGEGAWSLLYGRSIPNAAISIWTKPAGGSEPATYDIADGTRAAVIAIEDGADADFQFQPQLVWTGGDIDYVATTPPLVANGPGVDLRAIFGDGASVGGEWDSPFGFTEVFDLVDAVTFASMAGALRQLSGPGNTGPASFSTDDTLVFNRKIMFSFLVTSNQERTISQFVGTTNQAGGTTGDPELDLQCTDLAERMRYEYSLPPLVHEGTSSFSPGLDPIFLIDSLFRGGGFYMILPPLTADRVGGDAVFSATMMGSAHPEIAGYLNDDPLALPYNASDFAGGGAPLFVRPPWAPLAVFSLDAEYQLAEPIPLVDYQTSSDTPSVFLVTFYVDWESSDPSGVAHITLTNGDGDVSVAIELDAAQRGIAASGSVFTNYASVPSGLVAAKIRMRTLFSDWRVSTSFYRDGERIASVGDFDAAGPVTAEDPFLRTVSIDSDGVVIGGIQITPTTFFDGPGIIVPDIFDFQPNASLSPSLGELVAAPGIDNRIAWNVLDEIVRAEQGAAWIDENGHGVFRNRDILRGIDSFGDQVLAEEFEVIAAQSLESIQWKESSEQLYGEVEVAYQPFGVDTWSNPTVWKLDQVRRVLAGKNFTIIVELDTPSVGFSFTVSARANQNGSGADLSANFAVTNVRQLDATTLVFTVTNNGSTGYLVNTDGSPGLSVEAEVAIVEPEQAFVRYDTGNGSRRTLPIANNPWIQVREAADSLAQWLVGEVTEPMPVLPGIPIKADPRIKLGDLVRIVDPTVTELNQRALVTGVSLTRVVGRLVQLLQIRPLAEPEEKVVAINVYTSNSTWFKPVGLYAVRVRVVGGGGGGGGCATTAGGEGAEGGGGGGGGYAESIILASALAASEPIIVGSGGTGVVNAAGNIGGSSSFGSQVAANGGGGGNAGTAVAGPVNVNSGGGGAATAGQIQVQGSAGRFGRVESAGSRQLRSFGGDSVMGKGARGVFAIGTSGEAGTSYGGGGSGAGNGPSSGTARAGGTGAGGVVIVEEFYSPSALNVSTEMYVPAIKTADESVISTTTLQNDDDLMFLSLQPGEYVLEAMIPWDAATAADFKWQLTFSGTLDWSRLAYASSRDSAASPPNELGGVQIGSPVTLAGDGVGSVQGLTLRGGFSVSTAGDLRFQFAQGTSDATNTTVRAGANLALIKVA